MPWVYDTMEVPDGGAVLPTRYFIQGATGDNVVDVSLLLAKGNFYAAAVRRLTVTGCKAGGGAWKLGTTDVGVEPPSQKRGKVLRIPVARGPRAANIYSH
jgi:hypothetical protein